MRYFILDVGSARTEVFVRREHAEALALLVVEGLCYGGAQDTNMLQRDQSYLTKLRQNLVVYFSESELRTLCFDIGVDYDDLIGRGKSDAAREIIAYLERRGCLAELVKRCSELRPNVSWSDTSETPRASPATTISQRRILSHGKELEIYGTTRIGKADWCDVVAESPHISAVHCTILKTPHGFQIQDEGSTNGTFQNGLRLPRLEATLLQDNDVIELTKVGDWRFVFRLVSPL
jgi:hypothetical protein